MPEVAYAWRWSLAEWCLDFPSFHLVLDQVWVFGTAARAHAIELDVPDCLSIMMEWLSTCREGHPEQCRNFQTFDLVLDQVWMFGAAAHARAIEDNGQVMKSEMTELAQRMETESS